MTLIARARALIARLNTLTVGGVGLATALGAVLVVAAHGPAESYVANHWPQGVGLIDPWLDMALNAATAALPAAIGAAYVGRPHGLTSPTPPAPPAKE